MTRRGERSEGRASAPVGAAGHGEFGADLEAQHITRRAAQIRNGLRGLRTAFLCFFVLCLVLVVFTPTTMFQCASRQSEAKTTLTGHYVQMETIHAEHGRFMDPPPPPPKDPRRGNWHPRYWYVVEVVDDQHWTGLAIGKPGSPIAGDVWRIDERRKLELLVNRCPRS